MDRIAVYGKGGIGKSTVTSNLSFSLSRKGLKVLQVGCDPKCDSTRPLLHGRMQTTVTEYMRAVPPSRRRLDDIVRKGSGGILCVEAGGPSPGVGCAGKGIVGMFSTLERMDWNSLNTDITLFDVLGDVVCGGFAVPMRPEHSDSILIVTSGEYMSLFAANNIMKGSLQFEDGHGRVAGLVLNRRGLEDEDSIVERFSETTGVPVICRLDRSDLFRQSEAEGCTVSEIFPESEASHAFEDLADLIMKMSASDLSSPTPLTDSQLDALYSGKAIGKGEFVPEAGRTVPKAGDSIPVLAPRRIGKGPVSAVLEAAKVTDIPVVIHGTPSCGYTMLKEVSDERIDHIISDPEAFVSSGGNIVCTGITPAGSAFGGTDALRSTLESLITDHDVVLVVSTCLPGMIGDDCTRIISDIEKERTGKRILFVDANRVDSGFDAHIEVIRALAGLVDPGNVPIEGYVNIIDDSFIGFDKGSNRRYLGSLLSRMDMMLGPGFLSDCSVGEIIGMRRYGTAVLCEDTRDNRIVRDILMQRGIRFMDRPLPKGLSQTVEWIKELASLSGREDAIDRTVDSIEREYRDHISGFEDNLSGRSAAILSWRPSSDIWIKEALEDCGCRVSIHSLSGSDNDYDAAIHDSVGSMNDAVRGCDLVIDCMGVSDHPRAVPAPETWATHRASMDLIRRTWGVLMSDGRETWKEWGD